MSSDTSARAPEALLATAVGLGTSLEAAAALAAHLRVVDEGLPVDPEVARLLAAVAAELLGTDRADAGADSLAAPAVVGMVRAWLHQAAELVDDPGRSGTWDRVDPALLQGLGRLSMAIADAVRAAGAHLDGLTTALASPGASILDVGTGTGWLAIALARANPAATVVGIDVFEPALTLARANVAASGLGDRVELRHQDVADLADAARYDAVWLPLPFLPPGVVPTALARGYQALRPGGWLLPGAFAGPPDHLSQLLVDLRTARCGGRSWPADELLALLADAGFAVPAEVPRTWAAPVRLFAARRPET